MSIKENIEKDFIKAMKEKEILKVSTLRMVKAAIKNSEIDKRGELDDQEIIKLLDSLIKKRQEAIQLFREGNREDLAAKEEQEIAIIENYLPKALSEEEIMKIVDETIKEVQAESIRDLGKVMKAVMEKVKGQRIDGKMINNLVKNRLEQK